jgi:uncharacterized protein (TIGR02001 family)
MKNTKLSIALVAIFATATGYSTPVMADTSANVGVTSNYLWRGVEQTNGSAAVSGGIDYSADSGFYLGTWASNADWAAGMTYELDVYGGYTGNINESVSYDVGFIYYAYPDEASGDADFAEIYANFSFADLTLGVAVLADGEGADAGDTLYVSADYEFSLSNDATVALHLGSYSGDWLAEDYIDYGISLSKDEFTFGLSNTDLDNADVKVYVSYAKSFDL